MWNRHKHHKEKDTVSSAFAATVLFWFGLFGLCVCVFVFVLVVAVVFIICALIYYLFQEMNEKNKDTWQKAVVFDVSRWTLGNVEGVPSGCLRKVFKMVQFFFYI